MFTPKRGRKFNDLTFRRVAKPEEVPSTRQRYPDKPPKSKYKPSGPYWIMDCSCGKTGLVVRSHNVTHAITKSCGHRRADAIKNGQVTSVLRNTKDEGGKEYDDLVVLRKATADEKGPRGSIDNNTGARWLVHCKKCGHEWVKRGLSLRTGRTECPACDKITRCRAAWTKDRTGERHNFLEPIRLATPEERDTSTWQHPSTRTAYWVMKCHNCDRDDVVLPAIALRQVRSCGCLRSQTVRKLNDELKRKGLLFQPLNGHKYAAREKHLKWKAWKKAGQSYSEIAQREYDESGLEVSRDAVAKAIKRL